jgi:hypothetical protein
MPKVVRKDNRVLFECPGCKNLHQPRIEGAEPVWSWNNDLDKPTINPSIRARWDEGEERVQKCCHFFVRDGCIEFCGDSTHELAGKTVEMQEVPEWASRW